MSDRLVSLGRQSWARSMARTVGVNLPPTLERDPTPWSRLERSVRLLTLPGGLDLELPWSDAETPDAVVLDATGLSGVDGLDGLYDVLHGPVRDVRRRVVVLGPTEPIARAAVEGFTRSVAKELGRRGATANLLIVEDPTRLMGVLPWLLSPRPAFVTGQPLVLTSPDPVPWAEMGPQLLAGKRALVTGAARGIGAATARALAREGAQVCVVDRDDPSEVAAEIGGDALSLDLTDPDSPAAIAAHLGPVDVVVHNAGITRDRTLGRMEPDQWGLCLEVNLRAMLRLQAALTFSPGARVTCLSSIAGLAGNVGQTNYATAKAAVAGWVRATAPALAADGIALNAVAPGFIETRMTAAIPLATREGGRRLAALGQGGLPSDVAEVLTFLSTPAAGGLTGQVLRVCGGSLIGA